MIKKILSLFTVLVLCSGASYMDQEQKYFFASDALIEALQNNVDDEQKRVDAATKYSELMNQQTGMVSIDNLFAVCRAAGFNTYKKDGFDSCKQLINTLVELDEDTLTGFCPGLDANGNNPNGLKSITDKTRIGDFCSSTNIYAGEVVFKKGYNCTCLSYACNDGYEFKGGSCVTIVADGQGFCLRSDNKIQKDMKVEEAKAFCENLANKNKCKYKSAVILHKELRILCNATREEIDNAKQIMADHKVKQISAIKYYEVCGKDKGKTGKKEYCVEDFFNWTQTQPDQAIGFAQEYARIKNNHTVYCKNQHRESGNDDYMACSTMDGSAVYEFKFDDIKESVDKDRRRTERSALCRLAGGDVGFFDASNDVCKNLNTAQCANLDKLAKKYGHEAKWDKNKCRFTDYGHETMSGEDFDKSLAKIDGLDNYAFFNIQVISIRNNFALEEEMKKYIKNNLSGYQEVRCDPGYRTIKKADGFLAKVVGNHDDIKRCYANDKPIDFVVDDLSELVGYERDSGESGAKCIANDGKFDGHYCRGLTKDECFELERLMLKELKSRGWAGDDDLVDWDERAGACELNASQFANNLNKTGKYTAIAGLTIAGVFTGGTTTAVAVSLMSVELAGMAGEIVTERQKELLPQRWANRFLAESMVCKQASCAEKTLRENIGKIAQASDMLNRDVLKQVDDELARLAELLPDDRLAEILQNPKAPGCWETWECQETIFTVMQMASLGAAVGKALVKLPQVLSKRFAAVAAKNATNGAVHAGAVTNAVTKAIDNTADAATKVASKADDVVDAVWDAKAMRFHDPKTGRFVSGYTKWSDELSEIGVKESVVNGKKVYTDVKTGATLSETQVLNKIPTSMNDDFAKIGVRQIEQADGTVRYLDITPGGGNKFISEAEVLKRIDDMPVEAAKAIDNTADAARGASKADDAAHASKAVGKADDAVDTARGVSNTANNTADVARTAGKTNATDAARAANNTGDAYVARFGNIKMAQKDEDIILDAIAKKQAGKLSTSEHIKAIRTMDKYFDQAQAVRYAQQMRQDIIESVRLNVDEFTRAGDSGEDIARFFVKHLGPKYGIRSGQLKVVSARLPEGYAQYVDGVIYINSNMKALDFDKLTNLVIHEFGHAIDDLAPQYGVIGRALNAYGDVNTLYVGPGRIVDKGTDLYKLIPTERSSHLLGDIVSGTANYGNTKNGSLLSKEIANVLGNNNIADAARAADKAVDATRAAKINAARQADNLGFHGTDADIAMTDKIRPSGNTSDALGSVGYGIAKNYDDAEKYAIRRLIERQNSDKFINFKVKNGVLEITAGEPLNLSNKTGYVYTTAKESNIAWEGLNFSHNPPKVTSLAAKMPNAVEILDKTVFNLDDLIRSGKVKINIIH